MSRLLIRALTLAVLLAAALWLRVRDLDRRPMHADEANQAVKTDWRFLFAGCPAATYVKGNGVRHADFTKPRKSEPKL